MDDADFLAAIRRNPNNAAILDRLGDLEVDDVWLVAGCLFQTVWNLHDGADPIAKISDYDIFYYDPDTSWDAEDDVIIRANALFADLDVRIEVRNQARVHLWFELHFGYPARPLVSARDGIESFLIRCTCVGVNAAGDVHAPDGFADLEAGILRPHRDNPRLPQMLAKAESYRKRWPWLTIEDQNNSPSLRGA